ncbi:hypothetical protein [Lichenicola sp.]|uniref:hypothetical protein n=1 Tax=Lichenicola sp. TaxID=2804529 RepID=UPI003B004A0C
MKLTAVRLAATLLAAASPAAADETCRFTGRTSYDGTLAIGAHTTIVAGALQIDVRLQLDANPLPLVHTHYVMQEVSAWSPQGVLWIAVNDRYRFDGHIVRQQWDVYRRVGDTLQGYRLQGKRLPEFERRHPGFVQHWNPARFGDDWLADYAKGAPDRRPDLDLTHDLAEVRVPLALSFYWLRLLPPGATTVSVFLPGFKEEKRAELAIGPSVPVSRGGTVRQAPIHYPYLSPTTPSTATVQLTPDHHIRQLMFDLHGVEHSARGVVAQTGCTGTPLPPEG